MCPNGLLVRGTVELRKTGLTPLDLHTLTPWPSSSSSRWNPTSTCIFLCIADIAIKMWLWNVQGRGTQCHAQPHGDTSGVQRCVANTLARVSLLWTDYLVPFPQTGSQLPPCLFSGHKCPPMLVPGHRCVWAHSPASLCRASAAPWAMGHAEAKTEGILALHLGL